ncbi:MAG: hypothetical protein ACE5GQ_10195 [Nitrospinales bacterium]
MKTQRKRPIVIAAVAVAAFGMIAAADRQPSRAGELASTTILVKTGGPAKPTPTKKEIKACVKRNMRKVMVHWRGRQNERAKIRKDKKQVVKGCAGNLKFRVRYDQLIAPFP